MAAPLRAGGHGDPLIRVLSRWLLTTARGRGAGAPNPFWRCWSARAGDRGLLALADIRRRFSPLQFRPTRPC